MKSLSIKLFSISLISCLGIIVYSNTFQVPFQFDDEPAIILNSSLRNFHHLQNIWNFLPCRFVLYISFALNYHFHQLHVFGYHLVNLAVHLISAILVWWLTLLTLSTPVMKEEKMNRHANIISLFAGLIFVSHPIQTEAVTYILQRAASMATMFYLASLCFYIKSRLLQENDTKRKLYYICSLISAILAMFSKEIAITLPLTILLYEYSFLKTGQNIKWKYLVPFLLTILVIPLTMHLTASGHSISSREMQSAMEGSTSISPTQYLLTQFKVMITYLRLLFVPLNQHLDYDYPIFKNIFEFPVLISVLLLGFISFFAQRLFSKYRLVSFSIFWFFLTLVPESGSFWLKDVINEHRLYLPMAGYSLFLVSGVYYIFSVVASPRGMIMALTILVACNSILTYERNKVWKDEFSLWDDSVRQSPHKARPYNNRGNASLKQGHLMLAKSDFDRAVELDPRYANAYFNLGIVDANLGNLTQAVYDFNKAIEINPEYAKAYYNRGSIFAKQGHLSQALSDYNRAIAIDPDYANAYNNRGFIYGTQGNVTQAMSDFNKAIEINPNDADAYKNRAITYNQLKNR